MNFSFLCKKIIRESDLLIKCTQVQCGCRDKFSRVSAGPPNIKLTVLVFLFFFEVGAHDIVPHRTAHSVTLGRIKIMMTHMVIFNK